MAELQLIVALSLLAGALSLDATAALQVMLSQPLVAGGIAGAVTGDPSTGLLVGATLQLVWLGSLPVGAAPFPDGAAAGVAGAGGAALAAGAGLPSGVAVALGIGAGMAGGTIGQRLTSAVRRTNGRYALEAESRAESGDAGGVSSAVLKGLSTRLCASAALTAALLAATALASRATAFSLRALDVPAPEGSFATFLWAAPVAAAAVLVGSKGALEKYLLAAGLAVGLALAVLL